MVTPDDRSPWDKHGSVFVRDAYPGGFSSYSEYRVSHHLLGWTWQLVSVSWDDQDQVTEVVVAESVIPFDTEGFAMGDADKHFRLGDK